MAERGCIDAARPPPPPPPPPLPMSRHLHLCHSTADDEDSAASAKSFEEVSRRSHVLAIRGIKIRKRRLRKGLLAVALLSFPSRCLGTLVSPLCTILRSPFLSLAHSPPACDHPAGQSRHSSRRLYPLLFGSLLASGTKKMR